jgi:hypothetical protein
MTAPRDEDPRFLAALQMARRELTTHPVPVAESAVRGVAGVIAGAMNEVLDAKSSSEKGGQSAA